MRGYSLFAVASRGLTPHENTARHCERSEAIHPSARRRLDTTSLRAHDGLPRFARNDGCESGLRRFRWTTSARLSHSEQRGLESVRFEARASFRRGELRMKRVTPPFAS